MVPDYNHQMHSRETGNKVNISTAKVIARPKRDDDSTWSAILFAKLSWTKETISHDGYVRNDSQ